MRLRNKSTPGRREIRFPAFEVDWLLPGASRASRGSVLILMFSWAAWIPDGIAGARRGGGSDGAGWKKNSDGPLASAQLFARGVFFRL